MAEEVVDVLEAIETDDEQRTAGASMPSPVWPISVEMLEKGGAVRKSREGIAAGEILQPLVPLPGAP